MGPPSKVAQKYSIFFSPIAAQMAQTEEFMFQNVAYKRTVYKTEALYWICSALKRTN